jgi:hypothetical protein
MSSLQLLVNCRDLILSDPLNRLAFLKLTFKFL